MKPAYIPIYKVKPRQLKVFTSIAILVSLWGLIGIINHLWLNQSLPVFRSISFNAFVVLEGAVIIFIGFQGLRNSKYFVAWTENEFNYLLPKNKQMETVPVSEIESIQFEKHIIKITLKNGEQKHFNLNYLFLPKRRQVSEYFESLNSQINQNET